MAAAGDIQALCEEATCPVCLEFFTDPVTIVGCGHNFCRACLSRYWGKVEGAAASCPQCRETVPDRSFTPNRTLANFVEITKKLRLRGQGGAGEGAEGVCEKHQEPLKLFCKYHQAPICVVCNTSKEHRQHNVVLREEAFQEYKDQMCSRLKTLRAERDKILTYKADAEKESRDLLNQTEAERQETRAVFRQLRQLLEEQEKRLLAQVEEVEKEIARRRDTHVARLSEELSSLENVIREMEEKCRQPAGEFLQDIGRTLQRSEKKEAFENPVAFPPELTCRIGEFYDAKSLLETVMNQFPATGPEDWRIANVFKKRRRGDLGNYMPVRLMSVPAPAANVTLDPDTAHPQLVLLEDGRRVRWGDKHQDLPKNPERFDSYPVVLGREGFTSGRHFWEVTVGSEGNWAVGVARKSVRRKSGIYFSPEGGIWAVGKSRGGVYKVFTALGQIPLSLGQELRRIRVTLNCAEGQVGFSDADTGAHLYTFSGASFRGETLLPFFYVYSKAHLKLSP